MSTSNSPQTLFRFVSLRNPHLAENSELNLRFIHRPKGQTGFFDSVTSGSGPARLQALRNLANTFAAQAITSVSNLDSVEFQELIKIGKSASQKQVLTSTETKSAKDFYGKLKDNKDALNSLWDNLIYQYLTQSNFYVKEAIAHILKGYHIGYVQSLSSSEEMRSINGEQFLDLAINATIVLPEFLFQESISTNVKKKTSQKLAARGMQSLEGNLEKQENLSNLSQDEQNLQQLKSELQSIESTVSRNNQKGYKSTYNQYLEKHKETLAKYQDQLEVIRSMEENDAKEEELRAAFEVLRSFEVPPFSFENTKALDWNNLYSNLSEESFALFLEHFTNAPTIIQNEIDYEKANISVISDDEIDIDGSKVSISYDSIEAIYNEIEGQSQTFSKLLLNNSDLKQEQFANIGGVLIPVSANRAGAFTHLSYIIKATKPTSIFSGNSNRGYVNFQIQLEDTSWNISHASVAATTNLGPQSENFSNLTVVDNTLTFPHFLVNKFRTISSLTLNIFFENGRESVLELTDLVKNRTYTGILTLKPVQVEVPEGGDGTGETEGGSAPALGNYFGLKRLGVAEYMKVVQTVHAYVPGEVSNIENVMASELRHKSINELTRTEQTVTTTTSQEIEKISDTSKTNRAEMQTEVAKELAKQRTFQAHANFSYDAGWKIDLGTSYATNNSQTVSNRQTVTKAQEITERAMERVQSKITEERIMKIIQEVSLTNVHEFDNRGGTAGSPKHITGVYRWVDKKMKNQIFNYGKRTMFEFMIPEPAKLHRLAYANADTLTPPVDPRKAPAPHTMANVNSVTNLLLEYWAGIYGVNLTTLLPNTKQIIHNASGVPDTNDDFVESSSLQIPENYVAKNGAFVGSSSRNRGGGWSGARYSTLTCSNLKGDMRGDSYYASVSFSFSETGLNVTDDFEFKVAGHNVDNYNVKATINCELSLEYINAWKLENFNAIIEAYTKAFEDYKTEKANIEAEQKAKEAEQKDSQSNFYRIIESHVLRHNCIAYLLQNYLTSLGQEYATGTEMLNFKVNLSDDLDKYTATAKFLEQAFEWSIMDYTFYPYYWASRKMWQEMYLTENVDALFRGFMQAGLARVIVTVKPGFEEAVQYFLTTGEVWMGGETPIIGDPLYVSITQEMQEPVGIPQGNYWITRIPTTLTILQAKSTGLEADQPLPIFPELEPEKCENPEELENASVFNASDIQMIGSTVPTTLPTNIITP